MPTGSCLCGAIQLSYTGEPVYQPKTFTKTSDHGTQLTSSFCGDCGSTLYREGGTKGPGMLSLRTGLLDDQDVVDGVKVQMEVYVERRPRWVSAVEGAEQRNCRYELIKEDGKGKVQG